MGVDQGKEEVSIQLWRLTARALAAMPDAASTGNPR
jgi:hypothetical protein